MIGARNAQNSYNPVLNEKSNDSQVLRYNADMEQHSKHCKKGFLYNCRMMFGALSHQHSYYTV